MLTPVSVALYDMAGKIPDGFNRLFSSLIVVYFPSVSELLNNGKRDEARRFMNRGLVLGAACLSFAALGVFLFRDEVMLIVAHEQYLEASFALALLMINFNLNSIARMMGYSIVAAGYTRVPVKINLVSSAVNIVGCLIFIPRFGFVGAVYSLLFMSVISQILHYFFLVKVDLKPEVIGFAKSTFFMLLLVGGYMAIGNDAYWLRGVVILIYMILCWFSIPEIKPSIRYGLNFLGFNKGLPSQST
jgi:O-antigen/teichoic acid export membrane protein